MPEPSLSSLKGLVSFHPKKILILAPHPDDECLMAGFALRAKEEFQSVVKVIPFSYGSKKERRIERKTELLSALQRLNFELADPRSPNVGALEELTADEILSVLLSEHPDVLVTAHLNDGHATHVRSGQLAEQALHAWVKKTQSPIHWLKTEFWQSMAHPNVLIPLTAQHLTCMGEALLQHQGEVSRNPYHLTLPAWSMDQLRRGSEMLESHGKKSNAGEGVKEGVFAQIYRLDTLQP